MPPLTAMAKKPLAPPKPQRARATPPAPWVVADTPPAATSAPPVPAGSPWQVPVESAPLAAAPVLPVATVEGQPPPDLAERVRATASKGGSLKTLHGLFGVSADIFKGWMDADPAIRVAFDEGKESERESLHRTLYERAVFQKDTAAAQFLLKTRHGYREAEPEDTRNSVRIIFNLPAAAPDLKTYMEQATVLPAKRVPAVIDHE